MSEFTFTEAQVAQLKQPLDAASIKHRKGGKDRQGNEIILAYLKGKSVIDTANAIFGYGQWGYNVVHRSFERVYEADGTTIRTEFYTADIELSVVGAMFPFPGDGIGIVPQKGLPGENHEKARKEAVTDALKRALRHYGAQFGNDLYDEDALVESADGSLVTVKSTNGFQRPAQPQRPQAAPQGQQAAPVSMVPAEDKKQRIGALFTLAQSKGLITPETSKEAFIVYIGSVLKVNITNVGEITESRLKQAEKIIKEFTPAKQAS